MVWKTQLEIYTMPEQFKGTVFRQNIMGANYWSRKNKYKLRISHCLRFFKKLSLCNKKYDKPQKRFKTEQISGSIEL